MTGLQFGLVLSIGSYVLVSWLTPVIKAKREALQSRSEEDQSKSA